MMVHDMTHMPAWWSYYDSDTINALRQCGDFLHNIIAAGTGMVFIVLLCDFNDLEAIKPQIHHFAYAGSIAAIDVTVCLTHEP